MSKLNLSDLFIRVPITEKPGVDGWYIRTNAEQTIVVQRRFENGEWTGYDPTLYYYLRPVTESDLVEWKREVAGKAFEAGQRRVFAAEFGKVPTTIPDLETYLSQL